MSATKSKKLSARQNIIVLPPRTKRSFYGDGIPGADLEKIAGKLIVIEGADGSGRSTQINQLVEWLEGCGHATIQVGLKRSTLVSEELELAQQGNTLSRTTLSLFYATDFADQLENVILPSLRAGMMVLADRYIYTLMARDLVRGMDEEWLKNLYGLALVPGRRVLSQRFAGRIDPAHLPEKDDARLLGKRHGRGTLARHVRFVPQIPDVGGRTVQAAAIKLRIHNHRWPSSFERHLRRVAAAD